MKNGVNIIGICAILWICPILALADTRTADYFLNNPEKYEDKKITLNCSYVERVTNGENPNVVFLAYTTGRYDDFGASFIQVVVKSENASQFARKYGHDMRFDPRGNVKIRPLSGIFTKDETGWFLVYAPSE